MDTTMNLDALRSLQEQASRFWTKVDKRPHMSDGCWLWMASKRNSKGYGQFWADGKIVPAHRWAYEQFKGPIPDGLQIDHLCRTPACVNPAHLEAVTAKENNNRGNTASVMRSFVGERNSHSTISDELAMEIYFSEGTHTAIAERFSVGKSAVHHIKAGNRKGTLKALQEALDG